MLVITFVPFEWDHSSLLSLRCHALPSDVLALTAA